MDESLMESEIYDFISKMFCHAEQQVNADEVIAGVYVALITCVAEHIKATTVDIHGVQHNFEEVRHQFIRELLDVKEEEAVQSKLSQTQH